MLSLITLLIFLTVAVTTATFQTVLPLTQANFDTTLQQTELEHPNSLFLLEFYAPWCGHCKKLQPVLDSIAANPEIAINIGKIDCTKESALKARFSVKGYPTVLWYRNGDHGEFEGARTEEGIKEFVDQMTQTPVKFMADFSLEKLKELSGSSQIITFVSSFNETSRTGVEFSDQARKHQAGVNLFLRIENNDASDQIFGTENRHKGRILAKIELDEKPVLMGVPSPTNTVESFIVENQFPLVSELMSSNFRKLGAVPDKSLYVTAIDWSNPDDSNSQLGNTKELARAGKHSDRFVYGYIDGGRWGKFLEQFGVFDLPATFVLEMEAKKYFPFPKIVSDDESEQNRRVRTVAEQEEFLGKVKAGEIDRLDQINGNGGGLVGAIKSVWAGVLNNLPYSLVIIVVVVGFLGWSLWLLFEDDGYADLVDEVAEGEESKKDK